MELVVISLFGALIVMAMILLVAKQANRRNLYWKERAALGDRMLEKDREWLEEHGVHVRTH